LSDQLRKKGFKKAKYRPDDLKQQAYWPTDVNTKAAPEIQPSLKDCTQYCQKAAELPQKMPTSCG